MKQQLTFDQHYYTASIFRGGFYTLDSSMGLNDEEIDELEKKVIYKAPLAVPRNPTNQQIADFYPYNLCFFQLKSGRYVYLHSTYTGRTNHTPNRFGNFFSHSLILKQNTQPSFPAASVLEGDKDSIKGNFSFKTTFSEMEDESYEPCLKEVAISIDVSDEIIERTFYKYCNEMLSVHQQSVLSRIFDCIVDDWFSQRGTNITICDIKENLINWVLSINFLLPPVIANQLSFASYVSDPATTSFKLTGIMPENNIEELDEKFCKLIDARDLLPYASRNKFTAHLILILKEKDFKNWLYLNSTINELNINSFKALEAAVFLIDFERNIKNKNTADFDELMNELEKYQLKLHEAKFEQFLIDTTNDNNDLFKHILVFQTNNGRLLDNSFAEYFDKWIKKHCELYEWYVRLYINGCSTTYRARAGYNLIDQCFDIVEKEGIVDFLFEVIDEYICYEQPVEADTIREKMKAIAYSLGIRDTEQYPNIFKKPNGLLSLVKEMSPNNSIYNNDKRSLIELLQKAVFKKVNELPRNSSYDKFAVLFSECWDNVCDIQKDSRFPFANYNVEVWGGYFSIYRQTLHQQFVMLAFIHFVLVNNIEINSAGIQYLTLTKEQHYTLSILLAGTKQDDNFQSDLDRLKPEFFFKRNR